MAYNYSPKIVRNGLVLYYDTGNTNSYVSGSTIINDLTINRNVGQISGSTYNSEYGGNLNFTAVNQYIIFNSVTVYTAQIFAVADVGFTNNLETTLSAGLTDGGLRFIGGTFRNVNSADANDFNYQYPRDLWINGVKNPGNDVGSAYTVPNGRTLNQPFFVSCKLAPRNIPTISTTFLNRSFRGKLFKVLFYNRWLTDDEILQNYNTLKGRYGIT